MKNTLLCSLAALLVCSSARGQADLTLSAGNTAPFSLTLAQSMTYVITRRDVIPFFVFTGLQTPFGGPIQMSGNIVYTVNGGPAHSFGVVSFGSGRLELRGSTPAQMLQVGNVVTLFAGTLTSTAAYPAPIPSSGRFPTYIQDFFSPTQVSTFGTPVPEPSAFVLGAAGVFALVLLRRRRRGF